MKSISGAAAGCVVRDIVKMHIDGLQQLDRQLHSLPGKIAGRALATAVRAGARLVRDAARDRAPIVTGSMSANIVARTERTGSDTEKTAIVAVRNRPAYYWRFVEFGSRKMAARPFLRPAFDACEREAVDVITAKLEQRILLALDKY